MKPQPPTWTSYIGSLARREPAPDVLQLKEVQQLISLNEHLSAAFSHSIPAIFLLDYTTGRYITMSKWVQRILDNSAGNFLTEGINYTLDIYHKDDMRVFNEQLFPDRLAFMRDVPYSEYANYVFSYNFRLRNRPGDYVNILQRSIFLNPDECGNPTLSFGIIMQLGDYGSHYPMVHTIEKMNSDGLLNASEVAHQKKYYLHGEGHLLSRREKEVLLWIAEGLSCKKIAEKMHLSEHTIVNHKRHMLEKTGCLNAVALVGYAIRLGII